MTGKGNEVEPFVPLNGRDMAALEIVAELRFLLNTASPLDRFYQIVSNILTREEFDVQEIVPGVLAQMKKTKLDNGRAMIDNPSALGGLRKAFGMEKGLFNELVKQVCQE